MPTAKLFDQHNERSTYGRTKIVDNLLKKLIKGIGVH